MTSLSVPAPAKLNLCLNITGRRADGYHELQTMFQLLDTGDTLQFSLADQISVRPDIPNLKMEDNLIYRAALALKNQTGFSGGAKIIVDKQLPMGGGIGGGSSNAATTLLALNKLWNTALSTDQLADIGSKLGADVPVFVRGHSAWAEGVGEKLTPVELPEKHFLVLIPPCHVSTAEIFSNSELTRNHSPITMSAFFQGGNLNVCQAVVRKLYPDVDKALVWLEKLAPAQLTGTGCCVFASFDKADQAQAVKDKLPQEMKEAGFNSFIAKGANRSTAYKALGL